MALNTLKENPTLLVVVLLLVVASAGAGYFLGMSPSQPDAPNNTTQQPPQQEQPTLDSIEFNETEVLESHRDTVLSQPYYATDIAVYRNNDTAYVQQTDTTPSQVLSFTRDTTGKTTEIWVGQNQTLLYDYETENASTIDEYNFSDRQAQTTFISDLFTAGDFKYTNVSLTSPSHFRLVSINNTEDFALAMPAVSHQTNATITNVSINGTFKNGHIQTLEGTFEYTPEPTPQRNAAGNITSNGTAETYNYSFSFQVTTDIETVDTQTPNWVTQYQQEQTMEADESETNSSEN